MHSAFPGLIPSPPWTPSWSTQPAPSDSVQTSDLGFPLPAPPTWPPLGLSQPLAQSGLCPRAAPGLCSLPLGHRTGLPERPPLAVRTCLREGVRPPLAGPARALEPVLSPTSILSLQDTHLARRSRHKPSTLPCGLTYLQGQVQFRVSPEKPLGFPGLAAVTWLHG